MYKLGLLSLVLAVAALLHHKIVSGLWWQWSDFLHHEPMIGMATSVGITLLIVALVNWIRR